MASVAPAAFQAAELAPLLTVRDRDRIRQRIRIAAWRAEHPNRAQEIAAQPPERRRLKRASLGRCYACSRPARERIERLHPETLQLVLVPYCGRC